VAGLKILNPGLRIILTVSPVPLVATYTEHNVLLASSYSKAVLRAACGEVEGRHAHVHYFPSFEIISHPASFGQYLDTDLRAVTERGISHVMACFFAAFYGSTPRPSAAVAEADPAASLRPAWSPGALMNAECEEMFNDLLHGATLR